MNSNCGVTSNKLQQDFSTIHLVVRRLPNDMRKSRSSILRSKDSPGYRYQRRDFSFALATPFFQNCCEKLWKYCNLQGQNTRTKIQVNHLIQVRDIKRARREVKEVT